MNTDKDITIIAFTSGKGGCGKTTIAINFAYSLFNAEKSNKILVVDFDVSNKGSTGVFSKWTKNIDNRLTLTKVLNKSDEYINKEVLSIEDGFFFIPASSGKEETWKEPVTYNLNKFVEDLRRQLLEIASKLDVDCVVLDCFCGIDLLTTAGSASADHTIIINEPDIVTFTGSLNLKKHLDRTLEKLERKPKLHFVINRVRSNQKVSELNAIYKDNLLKEVNSAILTYIPFNNKIFANFGSYPFFIKLLPKSLFTKKIEQISYVLFIESHPNLVNKEARQWDARKFRRIYLKSVDKTAVDTEYLIVKLVSAPVLIGFCVSVVLATASIFSFTPAGATILALITTIIILLIFFTRILSATLLMARFHFTLASFLYKLGMNSRFRGSRLKEFTKSFIPFSAGLFISITIGVIVVVFALFSYVIIDEKYVLKQKQAIDLLDTSNVNSFLRYSVEIDEPRYVHYTDLFSKRYPQAQFFRDNIREDNRVRPNDADFIYTGLEVPFLNLNLNNQNVTKVDFNAYSDIFHFSPFYYFVEDFLDKVKFQNTHFNYCKFPDSLLNTTLSECAFSYCNFNTQSSSYLDIEDRYVHALLRQDFQSLAHTAKGGSYSNIEINGLVVDGIFFDNCTFNDVTLNLNENNFIALKECDIRNLRINLIEPHEDHFVYVFVDKISAELLQLGPNVEVRVLSNFKDQYFEEVYKQLQSIDREIGLYKDIIDFEKALNASYISNKLRTLKNLIEAYLMTYDPVFNPRIEELLHSLGQEVHIERINDSGFIPQIPSDIGIYYVLQTSFSILLNNKAEIEYNFYQYLDWVYNKSNKNETRKLGLWEFTSWNEQMIYNAEKLTENQIVLFELLQRMAFSDNVDESSAENIFRENIQERRIQQYEQKIEQLTNIYYENAKASTLSKKR